MAGLLTPEELQVLAVAAEVHSVRPGLTKVSVCEALCEWGLLRKIGGFTYAITDAGRERVA